MTIKRRRPKPLLIILIIVASITCVLAGTIIYWMSPVNSKSNAQIEVVIKPGTSTKEIGKLLKEKKIIKNQLFFQIYIKMQGKSSLKASTYLLKKNMSLKKIISILEKGNNYNPDAVTITFKEGQRITDYCEIIAKKTNITYEEAISIMQDREYIKTLIDKYWFLTDTILNEQIYYPLEGYLLPDTFQLKNKEVQMNEIIEILLNETKNKLEKEKEAIQNNIHEIITLASIVELEGTNKENRKMIAGILNNRLTAKMNLGSDVTTYYALQYPMKSDLTKEQFESVKYNFEEEKL